MMKIIKKYNNKIEICAFSREFGAHVLSVTNFISPEHVLGALAVDVPIGGVQGLGFV